MLSISDWSWAMFYADAQNPQNPQHMRHTFLPLVTYPCKLPSPILNIKNTSIIPANLNTTKYLTFWSYYIVETLRPVNRHNLINFPNEHILISLRADHVPVNYANSNMQGWRVFLWVNLCLPYANEFTSCAFCKGLYKMRLNGIWYLCLDSFYRRLFDWLSF